MPAKSNNNNNKKKKKNRTRSAASVYCATCQKTLSADNKLLCVCTRVYFCNPTCQQASFASGKHVCQGAPSKRNAMRPGQGGPSPLDNPTIKEQWQREYKETISSPMMAALLLNGVTVPPAEPGPEFWAKLADENKSAACAYLAGIQYKNRLLGMVSLDGRGGASVTKQEE